MMPSRSAEDSIDIDSSDSPRLSFDSSDSRLFPLPLVDQLRHSRLYFVPDAPDCFSWLSFRIVQWPFVALDAGDQGAVVAASHCDDDMRIFREIAREVSGPGGGQVDADLLHHLHYFRVDRGFRPRPG